jgi:hypothetical protein
MTYSTGGGNRRVSPKLTIALTIVAGAAAASAQAQYVVAPRDAFGDGVNAYFAGRCDDAETHLSYAIGDDSENPAVYYFRGLARLRSGCVGEAVEDMQIGATLEAVHPGRSVGKLLERVQGCDRLLLEKYRGESRANAKYIRESMSETVAPTQRAAPLPTMADRDQELLRERIVVPLDELLRPEGPRAFATGMAENWSDAPRSTAPSATSQAQPSEPVAESNPFDDDAALAPASPPSSPAEPAATPPEAEDNPFESP